MDRVIEERDCLKFQSQIMLQKNLYLIDFIENTYVFDCILNTTGAKLSKTVTVGHNV